jgi:Ca-activated chloride channel family protein
LAEKGQLDGPGQREPWGATSSKLRAEGNRENGNRLAATRFGEELPMRLLPPLKILILLSAPVIAQTADSLRTSANNFLEPTFRLDSTLVILPVTVADTTGKFVQGLQRSNFAVTDKKIQHEIVSFSRENASVSIGIVFDVSRSMQPKIATARTAVREFLRTVEQADEMFLVTFSDRAILATDFSSDDSGILQTLLETRPKGETALFDAVALAIRHMRAARNERKVLLLVSDGGDNHSRLSARELRGILEETEVQIHALGIRGGDTLKEQWRGQAILKYLAEMTGGEHHMVKRVNELPELAAKMSLSLHDRYVLAYRPTPAGTSGKWNQIRVVLRDVDDRFRVYTRAGYRTQ